MEETPLVPKLNDAGEVITILDEHRVILGQEKPHARRCAAFSRTWIMATAARHDQAHDVPRLQATTAQRRDHLRKVRG